MAKITARATQAIDAPAAAVYDVLADYREGHPRVLPAKYLSDLVVEEGGRGEGTVIRFQMHLLGGTRSTRAVVAEPVPGRVLTETYAENGAVTSFDVQPLEEGRRTQLTISTTWESAGLRGLVEGWLAPPLLEKIYRAEMEQIEQYVRREPAPGARG